MTEICNYTDHPGTGAPKDICEREVNRLVSDGGKWLAKVKHDHDSGAMSQKVITDEQRKLARYIKHFTPGTLVNFPCSHNNPDQLYRISEWDADAGKLTVETINKSFQYEMTWTEAAALAMNKMGFHEEYEMTWIEAAALTVNKVGSHEA